MIKFKNKTLSLFWEGPFTVKDDRIFTEQLPGVYLFSFKIKDYYSISYIGKTKMPLSNRLIGYQSGPVTVPGHIREIVSGRYWLYNPADLKKEISTTSYRGGSYYEYFRDLETHLKLARENLENTHFFLCPFIKHVDLINYAEMMLIYHAFQKSESYPLLDNDKKTANHILSQEVRDVRIKNIPPENIILKGLSKTMEYPKNVLS